MNRPTHGILHRFSVVLIFVIPHLLAPSGAQAQYDCTNGDLPIWPPSGANSLKFGSLSANGVEAHLTARKIHFFGHGYEVPAGSGARPLFYTDLVLGGLMNGELRIIRSDFQDEMWPGPLDATGVPPEDCSEFDRVFKVSAADVVNYQATGVPNDALLSWPWQLGAPVENGDGVEGNYDLQAGDLPEIEGHQMLWWVMNDVGGSANVEREPIGIEIQVSAFAVASNDSVLDYTTLYRYHITHHGEAPLTDAFFGMRVDPNLGFATDDFVGSDTTLGLAYVYNGDAYDEGSRLYPGYGDRPPALGLMIVDGILADRDGVDNDKNGVIDEPDERLPMTKFFHQFRFGRTPEKHYRDLMGIWSDGTPMTYGGNGRGFSETPVDFMYPGDPPVFWSEEDIDGNGSRNTPSDRRFTWSTGPFSMQIGESRDIVVAILWAQGEDRFDSVRRLKEAVPRLRAYWEDGFQIPLPEAPSVVPELFAPDDRASSQPTNLRLSWRRQPGHERHEVQVSHYPDFPSLVDSAFTLASSVDLDVAGDATYYWRVRGVNAGRYGPWSKIWSFSAGSVEQIGPGALDVDGYGTWAFVQVEGAEGENDACRPGAGSTFGCNEVGGNWVYGSFNGAGTWMMDHAGEGPEDVIGRFAPRDFELRFTISGSYAYHHDTSGRIIHVPFEAWDIGVVGPFGMNDPSDDVQLIPGLYSDNGGECRFGFGEVADDPFGLGWPVTDRIYAFYPVDGSTYDDWEATAEPLVSAAPDECPTSPETDAAALLVNVDRRPLQNLIFMMDPTAPSYRPEGIPTGNVIRFLTTKPTPPIPSAPVDESQFYVIGSLDRLSLWWQLPPGVDQSRVEVTRTQGSTVVVVDSLVSGSTIELKDLLVGYYSWRVSYST
ncbi:MAG TPA: hypothetical protein VIL33_01840, partial [Rhodothermia bacterium]